MRNILIIASLLFTILCAPECRKSVMPNAPLVGQWKIVQQHELSETVNPSSIFLDSNTYNNDSFAVTFTASGNYTFTYPIGILITDTSAVEQYSYEVGTYTVQDSILSVTTAFSGNLWQLFHGPIDSVDVPVRYKRIGTDTLITVSVSGIPGIAPFTYDSTVMVKLQ